jgi:hypothetical protein
MTQGSAFDHRPDAELGAALREALAAEGEPAFVARVVEAAARMGLGSGRATWWWVLETWARAGVAAALLLVAGATIWFSRASSKAQEATLEEVFLAAAERVAPSFPASSSSPPSFDRVLASSLEP